MALLVLWPSPRFTKCNTLKAEIHLIVQNSSHTSQETKRFSTTKISQEVKFWEIIGVYCNKSVKQLCVDKKCEFLNNTGEGTQSYSWGLKG
jgi:hypothetical protein